MFFVQVALAMGKTEGVANLWLCFQLSETEMFAMAASHFVPNPGLELLLSLSLTLFLRSFLATAPPYLRHAFMQVQQRCRYSCFLTNSIPKELLSCIN